MAIGDAWKARDKNKKKEEVKKKKVVTKKKENTDRIHSPVKTTGKKKKEENLRIHSPVKTTRDYKSEFMKDMSDPLPVRKDTNIPHRDRGPIDLGDVVASVKTKLVPAPHRNPTNKMVRVIDRPGKKRKARSEIPSHRMSSGGKLGIDNSGQKIVQKLYSKGGKI